jgi:hypothetical protein
VIAVSSASVCTSTLNLAELIRLAAERPASRVLDCGDPDPPTVREIGRLVCATAGHRPVEVLVPGGPPAPTVGASPWSLPRPFVVDMTAAERELGYRPLTSYGEAVAATCSWLEEVTRGRDWRAVLPGLARYPGGEQFDYAAEDAFLAGLSGAPAPRRGPA